MRKEGEDDEERRGRWPTGTWGAGAVGGAVAVVGLEQGGCAASAAPESVNPGHHAVCTALHHTHNGSVRSSLSHSGRGRGRDPRMRGGAGFNPASCERGVRPAEGW